MVGMGAVRVVTGANSGNFEGVGMGAVKVVSGASNGNSGSGRDGG